MIISFTCPCFPPASKPLSFFQLLFPSCPPPVNSPPASTTPFLLKQSHRLHAGHQEFSQYNYWGGVGESAFSVIKENSLRIWQGNRFFTPQTTRIFWGVRSGESILLNNKRIWKLHRTIPCLTQLPLSEELRETSRPLVTRDQPMENSSQGVMISAFSSQWECWLHRSLSQSVQTTTSPSTWCDTWVDLSSKP